MNLVALALEADAYVWKAVVMDTSCLDADPEKRAALEDLVTQMGEKGTDRCTFFLCEARGKLQAVRI